jgi:hypothetical protein
MKRQLCGRELDEKTSRGYQFAHKASAMSLFPRKIRGRRLRPLTLAFFVYQFLFFNVLLPGHNRGSVTVDGKCHGSIFSCCCCCGGPEASAAVAKHGSKDAPTSEDRKNCAFCNLAARLAAPDVLHFVMPPIGRLEIAPPVVQAIPPSIETFPTYLGRAPPAL